MLEKIKKIFRSTTSKNGSYSVGMIVLVIGIAVDLNMIAGQIPESYRNIDVSDNKIYEITDTSREMLKSLDKEIKFTVFAEKDSTDERIQTFLKKYTGLFWSVGKEKFNHTLPWITRISSTGRPTDMKVNKSTRITNTMVRTLMSVLSCEKEDARS